MRSKELRGEEGEGEGYKPPARPTLIDTLINNAILKGQAGERAANLLPNPNFCLKHLPKIIVIITTTIINECIDGTITENNKKKEK